MAAQSLKRNLYTILAADVAGYSRIMGADEEEAFRILRAHRAITDSVIELHGGRVFNAAGDSVLAAFESPVEAVRAAIEIQDAIKTRNLSLPEDRRLTFRIGINLGDVIVKDDDLLGDAVNVAARLESQADPGGLCISGTVYDQIVGKLDLQFSTAGELSLKNIQRPIRAYRFAGAGAARPPAAIPAAPRPGSSRWLLIGGGGAAAVIAAALIGATFIDRDSAPSLPAQSDSAPGAAATAPGQGRAERQPFDGVWSGSWCPRAFRDLQAFCAPRILRVQNGKIELESGQPGHPGYTRLIGTVSPSGEIEMRGDGISGQGRGRGLPYELELRGRIEGEIMKISGRFSNQRELDLTASRSPR